MENVGIVNDLILLVVCLIGSIIGHLGGSQVSSDDGKVKDFRKELSISLIFGLAGGLIFNYFVSVTTISFVVAMLCGLFSKDLFSEIKELIVKFNEYIEKLIDKKIEQKDTDPEQENKDKIEK